MNILVLGANGYTGSRLVEQLMERGHHVRGFVRDEDKAAPLEKRGMEIRVGDLTNPEAVKTLTRDIEAIYYLIGYCRAETRVLRALLEDGTRYLLADVAAGGVKKFIFASNAAVYGSPKRNARLNEDSPCQPNYPLGRLTLEMEKRVRERLPTVIVRVTSIYGPGRDYLESLKERAVRIINTGENWQSRIHISDLLQVLIAALERAEPGEIFLAGDDQPTSQKEFFNELALALQVPPPLPLEANAARAFGGALKAMGWLAGQTGSTLNENVIGLLAGNYYCANDRLKARLGIQLKYPSYLDAYTEMLSRRTLKSE